MSEKRSAHYELVRPKGEDGEFLYLGNSKLEHTQINFPHSDEGFNASYIYLFDFY